MVSDLAQVAAAYRAAQKAHEQARAAIPVAWERVVEKREALAGAIVAAYRDGARQIDIIRETGMSRERTRQILRAAGIEPED